MIGNFATYILGVYATKLGEENKHNRRELSMREVSSESSKYYKDAIYKNEKYIEELRLALEKISAQ
jgi:hypothetical protein